MHLGARILFALLLCISSRALMADDGVGWRGDGTGVFADPNPPTVWSKDSAGKTDHIVWQKKMPHYSWASPVVIGDRVYVRSEPYDLICMASNTGKVIWVRSHGPNELVSDEDRKNPLWPEAADTAARLDTLNALIYAESDPALAMMEEKYGLQKRLNDVCGKINRRYKVSQEMWRGKWSGYTGSTPCTDGHNIYFTSSMGATGCYDLDGNRKWMFDDPVNADRMGEHGSGSSPVLVGDRLIYCLSQDVVALNKNTGALIWRQTFSKGDGSPSAVTFESGGRHYVLSKGQILRVEDGTPVDFKDDHLHAMSMNATPVVVGNTAYFQDSAGRLLWLKWESPKPGELHVERVELLEFPLADESKRWENAANFWVPSPVLLNGLAYCLSNQGRMVIVDVGQKKIVYDKSLELSPDIYKSGMHGGYIVGVCASPTLAGGNLYIMDNTGVTLVMQLVPTPRVLQRNRIEQIVSPWDPKHYDKPHQEAMLSSPVFADGRVYYRGELFMYCIGN